MTPDSSKESLTNGEKRRRRRRRSARIDVASSSEMQFECLAGERVGELARMASYERIHSELAANGNVVVWRKVVGEGDVSRPYGDATYSRNSKTLIYQPRGLHLASYECCQRLGLRGNWVPASKPSVEFRGQSAVVEFVRANELGLIEYDDRSVAMETLVAAIAGAANKLVLILASTERSAGYLAASLRRVLKEPLSHARVGRDLLRSDARVWVGSLGTLEQGNFQYAPLLVVADAHACIGRVANYILDHSKATRVVGLLPISAQLSKFDSQMLVRRFGMARIRIGRHGRVERPVDVQWQRFDHKSSLDAGAVLVDIKRAEIWHGRRRNRFIARLAKSLAANDATADLSVGHGSSHPWRPTVGLLVENMEHAVQLIDLLPGWRIVGQVLKLADGQTRSVQAAIRTRGRQLRTWCGLPSWDLGRGPTISDERVPFGIILPTSLRYQFRNGSYSTLLRADGGRGMPEGLRPLFELAPRLHTASGMRLVDIDDRSHPALVAATQLRRRAYREYFTSTSVDSLVSGAIEWVDQRLGGGS